MKKKTLNRILLIVVLAIWAGIGFKLYRNYQFKSDSYFTETSSASLGKEISIVKKDSFSLVELNQDPFLDAGNKKTVKRNIDQPSIISKNNSAVARPDIAPVVIKWPTLKYYGFVKNHAKNAKLGVLRVDNSVVQVRAGDQIKDIKILKLDKDRITVRYNNQLKEIKKN